MRYIKLFVVVGIFMSIVTYGYSGLGDLLARHGADYWYNDRKDIEFCRAIEWGDTNKMAKMLKEGLDINKRGKNDITFLIYSYLRGNKNTYKFLLENGADPNVFMFANEKVPEGPRLKFYVSALEIAAEEKDPFYLEVALKNGGDPNLGVPTGDGDKIHILFTAVNSKNLTNVQLLIEAGADVNAGKKEGDLGSTPLDAAIAHDSYEIAYYLLQKGANAQLKKEDITCSITNFSIARRKIKKEDFIKMNKWERGFITMEQIEWRDKVIEILEKNGYKFPDNVKNWGWTNE